MYNLIREKRVLLIVALSLGFLLSFTQPSTLLIPESQSNIHTDSIIFAIIGDYGKAGGSEKDVATLVKSWRPDFIITTGDNNYQSGELKTIKENISAYYGDFIYNFDAPIDYRCNGKAFEDGVNRFFPTPGNHDAKNKHKLLPYLTFFTLPQTERYYNFVWGPVSFYSLNSVAKDVDEQKKWLFEQLNLSDTPFNIVYFHHSPYSPGPHGNSVKMQWDFYGSDVNVVFSGHDHIYSRIEKKGEEGLYYIVNGLGGRSLYDCDSSPLSKEKFDTFCYNGDYGAIKATATYNKLIIEFYAVWNPVYPIDRIVIE
jgi:hypothetical protein